MCAPVCYQTRYVVPSAKHRSTVNHLRGVNNMFEFIKQLLCKHNYEELEVLVYKGRRKCPMYEGSFMKCTKCYKTVDC